MTGSLIGTGLGMRARRPPRGGRAKPAIAIPHHALLLVNADIGLAAKLGCGVHLKSAQLMALNSRPLPLEQAVAASCQDEAQRRQAEALDVDFAVLGPVGLTLDTLTRAAQVLGCRLKIELAAESA